MSIIRLDKFLANSGIGTRSEVKNYIKFRRVWVDDKPVLRADTKIDIEKCVVTFDKRVVSYEKYCYIMMNKPKGIISASKDKIQKTVIDLLPKEYEKYNLFPVGRLDKDTVGLLILSNDGIFAHNTLSPKRHIEKTYFAHINGLVTQEHIEKFNEGIIIDGGYKCFPAVLEIIYCAENFSKIKITLKEGKYHQIKRMFGAFKLKVVYLKRLTFDKIVLDENLEEGEFRLLNKEEMFNIDKFLHKKL